MLLGFGYFHVYYVIFLFFFQEAENNRSKKSYLAKSFSYHFFVFV